MQHSLAAIDKMKGTGRVLLAYYSIASLVELLEFVDKSMGIRRDGCVVAVWEPDELDDCLRAFSQMTGLNRPTARVMIVVNPKPTRCLALAPILN
jgi:hypothetical protein